MSIRVKTFVWFAFVLTLFAGIPGLANAVPAFAQQTGQPCSQCHVGAFGPQLKPYGRDFKLAGYIPSDGESHLPTIAMSTQSSWTQTRDDQPALAAGGFKANDNTLWDQQISLYYGGQIAENLGGFIQGTYDGTAKMWTWDNLDVRYAKSVELFGSDSVVGVTVNNSPTVQDLWNSTPAWGFPYNNSSFGPGPNAAAQIDGPLGGAVLGAGVYSMWNDWIYLEGSAYFELNPSVLNSLGTGPAAGGITDIFPGVIPYWRAAVQHEIDHQYFEVGTLGLIGDRYPGGVDLRGLTDHIVDTAFDANYQYTGSDEHFVSAHAIYIHESLNLAASQPLYGTQSSDKLNTFRADISYSYRNTWTPTLQYFQMTGSNDAALWGTANGSPNSRGYVAELAYVPFGKPDSIVNWGNIRLGIQYVAYSQFNGTSRGASANNTLFISLWTAFAPFYAFEHH